ncbi:VF530 family protein [Flavobacterium ginsengiterrae]|uniref:VF530 family protein n=2 Tax=Flavobacterium ginsengiterrae TaxID=871695 RepID=A0ABP7GL86_9FLAO
MLFKYGLLVYKKDKMESKSKDPLHGITLQKIVETLVDYYGFDTLGELIPIKCFNSNPSIKSSLTFLRKTDWARKKVEDLYIKSLPKFS